MIMWLLVALLLWAVRWNVNIQRIREWKGNRTQYMAVFLVTNMEVAVMISAIALFSLFLS